MISQVKYITVECDGEHQRVDNYLIKQLKKAPRSLIYRIIRSGEVRVNKKRVKPHTRLSVGDIVRIPPIKLESEVASHSQFDVSWMQRCITYQDDQILVINKPSGMAVHGGSGVSLGCIEAMRQLFPQQRYLELVHRLDKGTSGVLLFAKKRSALRELHELLRMKAVKKTYCALLHGSWSGPDLQVVDKPLKKNNLSSGERVVCVDAEGKPSTTKFRLLENYQRYCLVEAMPQTGRTHQIRVHAAALGHPIVNDEKYITDEDHRALNFGQRLFLHASTMEIDSLQLGHQIWHAKFDDKFNRAIIQCQEENA